MKKMRKAEACEVCKNLLDSCLETENPVLIIEALQFCVSNGFPEFVSQMVRDDRKDEAEDNKISLGLENLKNLKNQQYYSGMVTAEEKEKLRKEISIWLGVEIVKIEQPDYIVHVKYCDKVEEVPMGIKELMSQNQSRNKIAAATDRVIPEFKPHVWSILRHQLLNLKEGTSD